MLEVYILTSPLYMPDMQRWWNTAAASQLLCSEKHCQTSRETWTPTATGCH